MGVTLDCNYKCGSEEIYNIYNLEAKYNVNFLSKTTVAYHRNLGQTLELLNENNYKKALSEQCNIFVFESGQWKALVLQQYTEWILLNKFFANRSYFECICGEEINISVSWEELQNRIAWYMHLSKLPIDKWQLARKVVPPKLHNVYVEYSREAIIRLFVNELDCFFTDIIVVSDGSLNLIDNLTPACGAL